MSPVRSAWRSSCWWCGLVIEEGQSIATVAGGEGWMHEECAAAMWESIDN